jgi:GT2 family glycosyltransferase
MLDRSISVVICAYTMTRWNQLCAAIDSVGRQTLAADETIVVADHNDELRDAVRDQYPEVRVVENSGARGLSGARNSGIAAARGSIVVFLDDDAAGRPTWLEHLVAAFDDPGVMIAGGAAIPNWPDERPGWMPEEFDWVVGCTYTGMPERPARVRNVIGCNMAMRSEVLARVGPFDEAMTRVGATPVGGDETEYCIRAARVLGSDIVAYEPAAVVDHSVSPDRVRFRYFRSRCYSEGVSKARLSRIAGAGDGLASERSHLLTTLPRAVLRDLAAGLLGRPNRLGRAGALIAGTIFTVFGYLRGRIQLIGSSPVGKGPFIPARPVDIETEATPRVLPATDPETGRTYERVHALIRHHGIPVSLEMLDLPPEGLATGDIVARARDNLTDLRPRPEPTEIVPATVVIATRDRPDSLRRCLESMLGLEYPNVDVIVVDNAPSSDATQRLVASEFANRVRYVREDVPGLAVAHNRGLGLVDRPIVAFTDDDVVVESDWMSRIVAAFEIDDATACVTGLIVPAELETAAQWWAADHGNTDKGCVMRRFDLDTFRPDDPLFPYAAGRVGSGANMAFRTDALRAVGGFVPELGAGTPAAGGDDLAVFLDVLAAGHRITYEPAAIVRHYHAPGYDRLRDQAYGYGKGLTAYLTHALVDDPGRAVDFLRRAPRALRHAFHGNRPPGTGDYPGELRRREWSGMLAGPIGFLKSRRRSRRLGLTRPR